MEIKVKFDAAAVLQAMEKSSQTTKKYIRRALLESCRLVQRDARANHKFKSKSGSLERAIRYQVANSRMEGLIDIDPAIAPYGVFVHEPTGIHAPPNKRLPSKFYRWPDGSYAVRPVNKKCLRFLGKDGKFKFSKQIRHPGTEEDRFLYKSAENNRSAINDVFARCTEMAIREVGL